MAGGILEGIRVIELATWVFVPSAGAVLADWGADVVKIENPHTGDPQRGLVSSSAGASIDQGFNALLDQSNRGKRSVALDVTTDTGRELLYRLVERADVFTTNVLPEARSRLKVDVEDLRAVRPDLIYARGSGFGPLGPESNQPAFDGAAYWARGGIAAALTTPELPCPVWARAGMGDSVGGLALANGILAALLRRERTGVGSVVDTSLLGAALWQLFPDVLNAPFNADAYRDGAVPNHPPRDEFPNPLTNYYKTKDGRYLFLVMMDSNRYWPILCERLDRPDLVDDARFSNAALRTEHRVACIRELDDVFATRTLSEWTARFDGMDAPWAPVQNALEVHDDQQVVANGYLPEVEDVSGRHIRLVAAPAQFDETPAVLERAPLLGEHTEEVLLEAGVTWDELIEHKLANVLL